MSEGNGFACSHCGEWLSSGASFCRHCGASEDAGWGDEYGDEVLPSANDEFDYDEFVAREFPDQATSPQRSPNYALILIVLVCVGLLLTAILAALAGNPS